MEYKCRCRNKGNYYICACGKSALYGEVHGCDLQDEYFTIYLNQGMVPYFLTPNRGKINKWVDKITSIISIFTK